LANSARGELLHAYVIVGLFDAADGTTLERVEELCDSEEKPRDALEAIRHAAKCLRPLFSRRLFSLKVIGGFGLYECHRDAGHHTKVKIFEETNQALSELFHDYASGRRDKGDMWKRWLHKNLNSGDNFPESRRLALKLQLKWSTDKVLTLASIPILLSIAIGFGYMYWEHNPSSDPVTITQTAWTIASYIVTTGGGNKRGKT
jgi:hypothetical protein